MTTQWILLKLGQHVLISKCYKQVFVSRNAFFGDNTVALGFQVVIRQKAIKKKSRIRETPTLLTDADSRTDTILERLRDLPIRTEKRTWSTRKCGLGPR